MTNPSIQNPIKAYADFVYMICQNEKKVEKAKLVLVEDNPNFDSFGIFKKIDKSCNGYIIKQDLLLFFKENDLNVSDDQITIFFNKSLKNEQQKITYNDFLSQILPQSNPILRDSYIEKFGKLSLSFTKDNDNPNDMNAILKYIIDIYAKELEYYKALKGNDFELEYVIKEINIENGTLSDFSRLEKFMKSQGYTVTNEDYECLLRRIDGHKYAKLKTNTSSKAIISNDTLNKSDTKYQSIFDNRGLLGNELAPILETHPTSNNNNTSIQGLEPIKSPYSHLRYSNITEKVIDTHGNESNPSRANNTKHLSTLEIPHDPKVHLDDHSGQKPSNDHINALDLVKEDEPSITKRTLLKKDSGSDNNSKKSQSSQAKRKKKRENDEMDPKRHKHGREKIELEYRHREYGYSLEITRERRSSAETRAYSGPYSEALLNARYSYGELWELPNGAYRQDQAQQGPQKQYQHQHRPQEKYQYQTRPQDQYEDHPRPQDQYQHQQPQYEPRRHHPEHQYEPRLHNQQPQYEPYKSKPHHHEYEPLQAAPSGYNCEEDERQKSKKRGGYGKRSEEQMDMGLDRRRRTSPWKSSEPHHELYHDYSRSSYQYNAFEGRIISRSPRVEQVNDNTVGDWILSKYGLLVEGKDNQYNGSKVAKEYRGYNMSEKSGILRHSVLVSPKLESDVGLNEDPKYSNLTKLNVNLNANTDPKPLRFYKPRYTTQFLSKYSSSKHDKDISAPILKDSSMLIGSLQRIPTLDAKLNREYVYKDNTASSLTTPGIISSGYNPGYSSPSYVRSTALGEHQGLMRREEYLLSEHSAKGFSPSPEKILLKQGFEANNKSHLIDLLTKGHGQYRDGENKVMIKGIGDQEKRDRESLADIKRLRSESKEGKPKSEEIKRDNGDIRAENREVKRENRELRLDSQGARPKSRELGQDSQGARSMSRELRLDNQETRSKNRDPRLDSHETRPKSRDPRLETKPKSGELKRDSQETRPKSRDPRLDSHETRPKSREPRLETKPKSGEIKSKSREPRQETRSKSREPRYNSPEIRDDSNHQGIGRTMFQTPGKFSHEVTFSNEATIKKELSSPLRISSELRKEIIKNSVVKMTSQDQNDLFGSQNDLFGSQNDRFGSQNDRFGRQKDLFESQKDRFGSQNDSFGSQKDLFGSQKDRFGSQKNRFGSQKDRFESHLWQQQESKTKPSLLQNLIPSPLHNPGLSPLHNPINEEVSLGNSPNIDKPGYNRYGNLTITSYADARKSEFYKRWNGISSGSSLPSRHYNSGHGNKEMNSRLAIREEPGFKSIFGDGDEDNDDVKKTPMSKIDKRGNKSPMMSGKFESIWSRSKWLSMEEQVMIEDLRARKEPFELG